MVRRFQFGSNDAQFPHCSSHHNELSFLIDSLSPLRMFFMASVNVSNELGRIQMLGSS